MIEDCYLTLRLGGGYDLTVESLKRQGDQSGLVDG